MGESVQVSCYVNKGDMPVDFSWMFNGKPIPNDISVNVTPFGKRTSVLSIEYVDQSHIGNFTCVASNKAGQASHSAELFVKGTNLFHSNYLPLIYIFFLTISFVFLERLLSIYLLNIY